MHCLLYLSMFVYLSDLLSLAFMNVVIPVIFFIISLVTCMVFVSTELITEQVPMDFFETKG